MSEGSTNGLQATQGGQRGPTIRFRIHHKRTLREGWSVDETTVEISGPLESREGMLDILEEEVSRVHIIGMEEATLRNRREGIG